MDPAGELPQLREGVRQLLARAGEQLGRRRGVGRELRLDEPQRD